MLYEFHYTEETDFEGFLKMMREKHPNIVNRKRLCVLAEEITDDLRKNIADHGVSLVEADK